MEAVAVHCLLVALEDVHLLQLKRHLPRHNSTTISSTTTSKQRHGRVRGECLSPDALEHGFGLVAQRAVMLGVEGDLVLVLRRRGDPEASAALHQR